MFEDYFKNSFTLSFDSRSTNGKTLDTLSESKVEIGSAQNINNPKYLTVTHQAVRIGTPDKANKVAVFDNLDVRKHHFDINGVS